MSSAKIIALLAILLGAVGLFLQSQGKLLPALDAIFVSGSNTNDGSKYTPQRLGLFVVALVILLFAMSGLDEQDGVLLVIVIVIAALAYNAKTAPKGQDVISQLTQL